MKQVLHLCSKIRGLFSASQCSDVGYDCRLTVVRPSFDCRSTMLKLCSVLVLILTIGVGNVWGTLYTMTVDQNANGNNDAHVTTTTDDSSQNIEYNDVTWTVAWTGKGPNSGSKSQLQVGTGSSLCSALSFSTDDIGGTITSVKVTTWGASSTAATVSVSVGGTAFKYNKNNTYSLTNTSTEVEFIGESSGEIQIAWSQSTKKAIYVSSITVTYSACSGTKLDAPDVTAVPSSNRITLSWPNDANATSYTVTCKNASSGAAAGSVGSVTGTTTKTCAITSLTNGTEYTWSVTANGNESTYCNSDPASDNAIPGTYYTVTFMNNGESYATKLIRSGTNLILPDNPSTCDLTKEFVGWSTNNIGSTPTDTKPTTFKSTFSTISSNTTLYAVFAKKTANSYKLGDPNDLIEGQKVLIVNQNAKYAMANTGDDNGSLDATSVTISSSKISSPGSSLVWTVELDGAKYKFKNTHYIYDGGGSGSSYNTNLWCDDEDVKYPDSWTISSAGSTGKYYLNSDRSTGRKLEYWSSTFTTYASGTTEAFKHSFFVPTYTQYVTTCVTCDEPTALTKGSFLWTAYFIARKPFCRAA